MKKPKWYYVVYSRLIHSDNKHWFQDTGYLYEKSAINYIEKMEKQVGEIIEYKYDNVDIS